MQKVEFKSIEESPPEDIKIPRLFDEFFIIGVDTDEIQDQKGKFFANPKTLYLHLKQEECERRRVVKDFCFPDGIELRLIKDEREGHIEPLDMVNINNLLANPLEQWFVFTLNTDEDAKQI